MKKNLILNFVLLIIVMSSRAQTQGPGITASTVAVVSGATTAVVPIKVADAYFVAVGSFSLTFDFDYANLGTPTVTYTNPAFATAGWAALTYTTNPASLALGIFKVSGYGPITAVSLSSGDIMFSITFSKATPGITSCGYVKFKDNSQGTACQFTGAAPYTDVYTDGPYTNGNVQLNKVYVDPDYDPGNGCDQFPTIKAAVNFLELSNDGGTVSINTIGHTYAENVTVTKNGITFDNNDAGTIVIDGNLTIPAAGTSLTLAGDLTVTGVLTLTDADDYLVIGANTLTLNGTIAGPGSLTSTSSSSLSIGGSGSAFGTINLNGNLNAMTINRDAQNITLGSCTSYPIEINTLNLTAGELVLGDNALQINTTYTPGSGGTFSAGIASFASLDFRGATSGAIQFSSSLELPYLFINTSGSIDIASAITMLEADVNSGFLTNSAAVSFGTLSNAATVTMGADITVTYNFQSTDDAAVVNVNAFTLTLNCIIGHTDDTYLNAGGTSSLAFGGADPIPAYTMPADVTTLNNLIINRELGVTLAANLDVLGTLTLTSGTFSMMSYTLTINNPMAPYPLTGTLGANPTATLIVNGTVSTPLPAMDLYKLQVNNDIGVVMDGEIGIYNYLDLKDGAVDNTLYDILIQSGATIERSGGSLSAEPIDFDHLHVLYTNTSSITEGFEIPSVNYDTHVEMNGIGGVVWTEDHIIDDLILTAGKITLGAFDFTTTSTTDGSASSYVIADGAGTFTVTGVTTADVFPVGYATGYTPLTISNSVASDFSVNLKNVTTLAGFTAPVPSPNFVKLQWVITRALGGTASVIFKWNVAEKFTTDPTAPVLGRYNGTDWVSAGTAGSWTPYTGYTVTVTDITAFSPFAAYGDLITPIYVDGDPTHGSATKTGEFEWGSTEEIAEPARGPKLTIQQGLTAVANPGVINVAAWTYPENIIVNKDVTIHGAGVTTIVNGTASTANGSVFNIATSGVTLEYMKINNTDESGALYAVRVDPSLNDILIQENTITNNFINGIVFNASAGTSNVVLRNKFEGTSTDPAESNEGITEVAGLRNYWGSDNGPKINPVGGSPSVNPCGDGKLISTLVTYDPWMNADLTHDIYQNSRIIKGTFYYPNSTGNIQLKTGINLTLKRSVDNAVMATTTTNASGEYAFDGQCTNCLYYIVPTSSNTTSGAINTTDAAQVNAWGVTQTTIPVVRFFAGDVSLNDFISSFDALMIQDNFVNETAFTRPGWSFYKDSLSDANPLVREYTVVNLQRRLDYALSDSTINMYGLATGDFNLSFNPDIPPKLPASPYLQLLHSGEVQAGNNQHVEVPIRMVNNGAIGAVSLIMNFPANLAAIREVSMKQTDSQVIWAVKGNELRISWYSINPMELATGDELLTLHLQTSASFNSDKVIEFTLDPSPLNELANESFDAIPYSELSMLNIRAGSAVETSGVALASLPNPFKGYTTLNYDLPFDGSVILEIRDMMGRLVTTLLNETQDKGNHSYKLDASSLSNGFFTATLKLKNGNNEIVRTIKLINNR